MISFKRLFTPITAMLALGAASAEARAPQPARPALWQVSDRDTTIYLFGTIHLLPVNYQWRTRKLDQAVASSQELVVETIVDEKDPTKLMSALTGLAFNTPNLPALLSRVEPSKREALAAAVKKSGLPMQALDRMETWAAAFILLGNKFREIGLSGGVEGVLRSDFSTSGKRVGELESNVEQLAFFDKLPETAQRSLLEGAIEDTKEMDTYFAGMLQAWSRGDVRGIARTFDRDLSSSPDLQKALIRQRNANWSKWIEQRMGKPGAVMIAVGAGHLAGKDSVLELLQKGGYKVRRLQ
jgi:uncharacterized protein YbaP (TraB family)